MINSVADVRFVELSHNRIGVVSGSSFHMRVADQIRVTGNVFADLSSTAFLGKFLFFFLIMCNTQ